MSSRKCLRQSAEGWPERQPELVRDESHSSRNSGATGEALLASTEHQLTGPIRAGAPPAARRPPGPPWRAPTGSAGSGSPPRARARAHSARPRPGPSGQAAESHFSIYAGAERGSMRALPDGCGCERCSAAEWRLPRAGRRGGGVTRVAHRHHPRDGAFRGARTRFGDRASGARADETPVGRRDRRGEAARSAEHSIVHRSAQTGETEGGRTALTHGKLTTGTS
jgi:hypothetical protein